MALLGLPLEVLTLILGHLELPDLLDFCATCRAVRQLFRPEKLHQLLTEQVASKRNQLAAESSHLMRHHALAQLFDRYGQTSYGYDWLVKLGASFAPIPHWKLLKSVFFKHGPGEELAFMEAHGASFYSIPGGISSLLEDAVREEYIGNHTDYLLARGAKLRDVPSGVEPLLDSMVPIAINQPTIEFILEYGAPLQYIPDSLRTELCERFYYEGIDEYLSSLLPYIPGGYQLLLENSIAKGFRGAPVDVLLENGASVKNMAIECSIKNATLEYLLEKGVEMGVDISETKGMAIAMYAAACLGDMQLIKVLLEKGVSVNAVEPNSGRTALHAVAMLGNSDLADYLLEQGADLSLRATDGLTPLHEAVNSGHTWIVVTFIAHGSELNTRDTSNGQTPLFTAICNLHPDIAAVLFEEGADPSIPDDRGWLPIHAAAECGDNALLKDLIKSGQDVNHASVHESDGGWTPLQTAASEGNLAAVEMLVLRGADIHKTNDNGFTAVHIAADQDQEEIIDYLFTKGASVNAKTPDGLTPLHLASENNHDSVVKLLIQLGAQVEATMTDGTIATPLYLAAGRNSLKSAEILIGAGAEINCDNVEKISPIFAAASEDNIAMLQLLLNKEAQVNVVNAGHFTPLHLAALGGHSETIAILLKNGAAADPEDPDGATPLHFTVVKNHLRCTRLLLEHGADPSRHNVDDSIIPVQIAATNGFLDVLKALAGGGGDLGVRGVMGSTCLHLASAQGMLDTVRYLVRAGVNINCLTDDDRTPVHSAASSGHLEVLRYLIRHGASYQVRDFSGTTPILDACLDGHLEVVRYLLDMGGVALQDERDEFNRTPLHWAIYGDHLSLAEFLIERGSSTAATDGYGRTAFDWAADNRTQCGRLIPDDHKYTARADQETSLKRSICKLSRRLLKSNRRNSETGFHELGHCFMFLGNMEAAELCYQQQICGLGENGAIAHNVSCEGCSSSASEFCGSRFVCTVCPDVDLCEACRNDAMDRFSTCQDNSHQFLEITGLPSGYSVEDIGREIPAGVREALEEWVDMYSK